MKLVLGYIEDNIAGGNVAAVPSRKQLRNDAALDIFTIDVTGFQDDGPGSHILY